MTRATRVLLIALGTLCGTQLLGWWAVPVVGALFGWFARSDRFPGSSAAIGAALGWAVLFLRFARDDGARRFAVVVGQILHLPAWVAPLAALTFAAALAGAGAALARSLRDAPAHGSERATGRLPR